MPDIIESILADNPELTPAPRASGVFLRLFGRFRLHEPNAERVQRLQAQQDEAVTYLKWYEVSAELDDVSGNDAWKADPASPHYDHEMVRRCYEEMRQARLANDYTRLLYLVRTRWTRNLGNMGDLNLYRYSHVGTKRLIEEYIEECKRLLDYLVENRGAQLDDRHLLGMLIQTRKNIGRTALVLLGGLTFGMSHIGVLVTLLETSLLPRIISGSSSGSIIASIMCCHTNEEIYELLRTITLRRFRIFAPATAPDSKLKGVLALIAHFLKYGTFFEIEGLQETMEGFVGDLTFREAYNRTGKILNVTVSPASMHEQTRLLNYLTAPHCLVWLAICASCSLPTIFPSTCIYEKNPRTNEIREWNNDVSSKYVDGSVEGDLPISRLSEMFNVDHIIAVQVNPHVSPVLKVSVGSMGGRVENDFSAGVRRLLSNVYDFFTTEVIHCLQVFHTMDMSKNLMMKGIAVLLQQYLGDITILPELAVLDFAKIFTDPTPEFLLQFILKGARAAWPKVTIINNHCGVEFALDRAITLIRGRIVASANKRIAFRNPDVPVRMEVTNSNNYTISALVSSPEKEHRLARRNSDRISKGQSTTALLLMHKPFRPSEANIQRLQSEGYVEERRQVRKARSSGSIHTFPKEKNEREKANFPRLRQGPNTSYVGLNRLKDARDMPALYSPDKGRERKLLRAIDRRSDTLDSMDDDEKKPGPAKSALSSETEVEKGSDADAEFFPCSEEL